MRLAWPGLTIMLLRSFALRAVGKNVDEVERELFEIVVNHHQIAVHALQFFFVGFDLHLTRLLPLLLVHVIVSVRCTFKVPHAREDAEIPGNLAIERSIDKRRY